MSRRGKFQSLQFVLIASAFLVQLAEHKRAIEMLASDGACRCVTLPHPLFDWTLIWV